MRLYQFHHRQLRYKIHHIIIYPFTDPVLIPVTLNTFFQKFFCHFQVFCNLKPVLAAMLKGSYQSDQTDLLIVCPKSCLTFLLSVDSRCHIEDIYEYFKDSETDGLEDAIEELGGDYTEEEIRLVRIKFLSEMAN